MEPLPGDPPRSSWRRTGTLARAAVVLAALVASYAPNLRTLIQRWSSEPNYSHGFLVIPIALAIAWQRRDRLDWDRIRPNALGWVALLAVLGYRAFLYEHNEQWIEGFTLILALGSLVLLFGGWPLLRWSLPALGFLAFMLPLPPRLNLILAARLQQLATLGSTALLQAMALPVLAQGNVIFIGAERLEVAQACNGLSMLMSFVTLVTALVILLAAERPLWERAVLLASSIPIALIVNILRIAATAWAYHLLGAERGEQIAHDVAGWAMMPVALVLVLVEMGLLSWVIVESEPEPPARLVLPGSTFSPPAPSRTSSSPGTGANPLARLRGDSDPSAKPRPS